MDCVRNVSRSILALICTSLFLFGGAVPGIAQEELAFPQSPSQIEYSTAKVLRVLSKGDTDALSLSEIVQQLRLMIVSGKEKGKEVTAQNNIPTAEKGTGILKTGDTVVLVKSSSDAGTDYYVADHYRTTPLIVIFCIFFAVVIFFGRMRGVMSIVGLGLSIFILSSYVVPQMLQGKDPLFVSLTGSIGIAFVSLYVAHGVKNRTTIALVSTVLTLGISASLAVLFVQMARLFGTGSEEALFLQIGPVENIDLRGLLLAGIMIGTLGVLDDITTAQTAAVEELKKANTQFDFKELYKRGLSIGREHIASLVNTLALAYAGVSLPLFLIFSVQKNQPLWILLNSEDIAEEIVRTLVGSTALILAVPIATALAAWYFGRR